MILKPNYLRAAAMVYMCLGALLAFSFVVHLFTGGPAQTPDHLISLVTVGGTFMVIAVCVMFVPRELRFDADTFSCKMIVQGSHVFRWVDLEAYGTGNNVFLLKFTGNQAIQISSFGFSRKDWKLFKDFIYTSYPDKRCRFWIGPKPIIRKKK